MPGNKPVDSSGIHKPPPERRGLTIPIDPVEKLHELIDEEWSYGREVAVKLDIISECAWGGELRYTPEPNREDGPDRSYVFYSAGEATPQVTIQRLLDDFWAWRSEGRNENL